MTQPLATLRATAEAARDAAVIVNDTEDDAQACEDADIAWMKLRDACEPTTILALLARLERAEAALRDVRAAITNENGLNELSIVCTVWVSDIETAVDCIDGALRATAEDRTP